MYVRDFPVLLARVLGQGPPDDVRRALAENIFEEQTGKLSLGVAHPELFLEMMDGLGIPRASIEGGPLEPEALAYRALLDRRSLSAPWIVGAAVLTIFVEGSVHERAEMSGARALPPVDEAILAHPMVRHYGCPPEKLRLPRAHRAVEAGHRRDAWDMVLGHAGASTEDAIAGALEEALAAWLAYRDGVARAMGLDVLEDARPQRRRGGLPPQRGSRLPRPTTCARSRRRSGAPRAPGGRTRSP